MPHLSARDDTLVVIVRNSPTTFYEDAKSQNVGIEHDLVTLLAKDLNKKTRFVLVQQYNDIFSRLARNEAHFATGIAITPELKRKFHFSLPYQLIQQQVVCNINRIPPHHIEDLIDGKLEVVAGSSHAERLRNLRTKYPQLNWHETTEQEISELLEKVAVGSLDYTIADSHSVAIAQNFRPQIEVAFDLGEPEYLGWAFSKNADAKLVTAVNRFFERIRKDGTLKKLIDRYYGHVTRLEYDDIVEFLKHMHGTLPHLRNHFKKAQAVTGLDWRLLAALGYQESHWDPYAESPAGARGLMMLTAATADGLGVIDRFDAGESIRAGADYLLDIRDALPASIEEPDRLWFALAAYNVGIAHLGDARTLAKRAKLDPNSWSDVKRMLPLLSKESYYTTLKHGYARGSETVILVERIRTYYDILLKYQKPYKPILVENPD